MYKNIAIQTDILLSAKAGSQDAFASIVERYQRPMYSFVYRMVNSPPDAEDLAQEAFMKIFLHIHEYDPNKNFEAWLFTITRRVVYDWLRKKKRRQESFIINDPDTPYDPGNEATAGATRNSAARSLDIELSLARITPEYREILLLYYWRGYTYKEIAEVLDMPINTVKTHLRRAKQAISSEFGSDTAESAQNIALRSA